MTTFRKAVKTNSRLRMALVGPSGSGKTYTALGIATALGKRVAVIDTERGSASKYSDIFGFDVLELESFAPERYIEGIKAASEYDVLVIDSLSHAWSGKDGLLEFVDKEAARTKTGNSFGAWRNATPKHNALVDAILGAVPHVIVTMRAKTEYVQEKDERGKTQIRKVGLAPVQRDGLEYEFDVVGDLDQDNNLIITKSRCSALSGGIVHRAGADIAETLKGWLTGAEPKQEPVKAKVEDDKTEAPKQAQKAVWESWRSKDDPVHWAVDQTDDHGSALFNHHNHAQNSYDKARREYLNSLTKDEQPKDGDDRETKWRHSQALNAYFFEKIQAKKRGEDFVLPAAGSQRIFEDIGEAEGVSFEAVGA